MLVNDCTNCGHFLKCGIDKNDKAIYGCDLIGEYENEEFIWWDGIPHNCPLPNYAKTDYAKIYYKIMIKLEEHIKARVICCDENCFCWDVNDIIEDEEIDRLNIIKHKINKNYTHRYRSIKKIEGEKNNEK